MFSLIQRRGNLPPKKNYHWVVLTTGTPRRSQGEEERSVRLGLRGKEERNSDNAIMSTPRCKSGG